MSLLTHITLHLHSNPTFVSLFNTLSLRITNLHTCKNEYSLSNIIVQLNKAVFCCRLMCHCFHFCAHAHKHLLTSAHRHARMCHIHSFVTIWTCTWFWKVTELWIFEIQDSLNHKGNIKSFLCLSTLKIPLLYFAFIHHFFNITLYSKT